jgi:hypothetical protein
MPSNDHDSWSLVRSIRGALAEPALPDPDNPASESLSHAS